MANHIEELQMIKGIGNFLSNYYSDLQYIKYFLNYIFKKKEIDENYFKKTPGSFQNFLDGYRVSRCFQKDKTKDLFYITKEFIKSRVSPNKFTTEYVDLFVEELKNKDISQRSKNGIYWNVVSLCSKILFLYSPEFFPYDRQAKQSLSYSGNNYAEFHQKAEDFKQQYSKEINDYLYKIKEFTSKVESGFENEDFYKNIAIIRENRLIDKFLWTNGD